jgi:hypothetical protein
MKQRLFTSDDGKLQALPVTEGSPSAEPARSPPHAQRFDQPWTITNPVTAALLARPEQFRYLRPFHGRAASAADVARELRVSLPRLRYWIMRALDAGLLVEVPAVLRRGRSVRLYRTRSDVLYLPVRATADANLGTLMALWSDFWQERFVRSVAGLYERAGIRGLRLASDAQGDVRGEWVTGPDQPAFDASDPRAPVLVAGWDVLHLDEADARALQNELVALQQRYQSRSGSAQYLLRLGLVPFNERGGF